MHASPVLMNSFHSIKNNLLAWYAKNKRILPWRPHTGKCAPYYTLLSEIMLQQTSVTTVIPYFQRFIEKFPDLKSLAEANIDEVHTYWQGLGYYRRATYLHKCAQEIIKKDFFPRTPKELIALPGIGPYASASISAIAFNHPTLGVDGNVERVFSRLFTLTESGQNLKQACSQLVNNFDLTKNSGDFNQALMDLGASLCTPRRPQCSLCPLNMCCQAYKDNCAEDYPKKTVKRKTPIRYINAFVTINCERLILLEKRPKTGLFANMWGVPCQGLDKPDSIHPSLAKNWQPITKKVTHIFSHFKAEVTIYISQNSDNKLKDNQAWMAHSPATFMNKIINAAQKEISR